MANALVSIGSFEFPTPSTYTGLTATIVNSARNVEGTVVGTVIREDVAKVSLTWRYLTTAQWAAILSKFTSAQGGAFAQPVTFFDQARNDWITRIMYVSDRDSSGLFQLDPDTGAPRGWLGPQLSLVEV